MAKTKYRISNKEVEELEQRHKYFFLCAKEEIGDAHVYGESGDMCERHCVCV